MIHQYRNNGYNIVMDVYSGAVHVVDDVCYDVIAEVNRAEEEPTAESLKTPEVKAGLLAKLGGRYEAADIEDALSDVIELTEGNQLFMKDIYEGMVEVVKERKTVVKALCMQLKSPYKEVAYAHFCQELSVVEIAQRTGKNPKTIQTQLYRARAMLKKMLERSD
mgnify:CR=1 FL=1